MSHLTHATQPRVSVIIKALNEERNIRAAIESALDAVALVGGEVILADSASTDRTVEIACGYPITVVQLAHPTERCCGIGPQLGYQFARGEYVYILDGDMRMYREFLQQAVAHLDAHPRLGGVGGLVVEQNTESLEYQARAARAATANGHMQPGVVDRLDMGGLYRRAAIEQVKYFSDRNLHSYEEIDLGFRLRAAGWLLERINVEAVDHHGHEAPPMQLLMRRWKTKYIRGAGEVLRASIGQRHFGMLLREMRELRIYAGTLVWVLLLLMLYPLGQLMQTSPLSAAALAVIPFVAMSVKKRSVRHGFYSVTSWIAHALGMGLGLLQPRISPSSPVASKVIREGA